MTTRPTLHALTASTPLPLPSLPLPCLSPAPSPADPDHPTVAVEGLLEHVELLRARDGFTDQYEVSRSGLLCVTVTINVVVTVTINVIATVTVTINITITVTVTFPLSVPQP